MKLFEVLNISQLKNQYGIDSFTLVDFTVGFDDLIYLLFSQKVPERIDGMFVDTKADTRYATVSILFDWTSNSVCNTVYHDLGVLEFNYHFIRPIKNFMLLIGARCEYHNQDNIEQNVLLFNESGVPIRKMCFGDGIENCITTADGKIITSYFDEGVFGNYGWDKPIGSSGLVVWNDEGAILWENNRYSICDCYAINVDSRNRLWFYYYTDFDLVCTDFQTDVVMHPDIRGCSAFAISAKQQKILFSGGYNDSSFYQCSIDIHHKIGEKQKVEIVYRNESIENASYHFCGSKLLFLIGDNLCGYYFI